MNVETHTDKTDFRILTWMVVHDEFLKNVQPLFDYSQLQNPMVGMVGYWCFDYLETYGKAPGRHILDLYDKWALTSNDPALVKMTETFLHTLKTTFDDVKENEFNLDYMMDIAKQYFADRQRKDLSKSIAVAVDSGQGDKVDELIEEYLSARNAARNSLPFISAIDWMKSEPSAPDQIFEEMFEVGDKVAIIGSSKVRKSFFILQMALSLASGKDFLHLFTPKPRRVVYCQFEIKDNHMHRRLRRMASALNISIGDMRDRFHILNGRGLNLTGAKAIDAIKAEAKKFNPEIIVFDPLYKIATGVENAAEDMKTILNAFDMVTEELNTAIAYVHHDTKGNPGDKNIRDRGSGSNVLSRDYDSCITLTPHSQDEDSVVLETLNRNYRPQEAVTITWTEVPRGYCFESAPNIYPDKKTSKSMKPKPELSTYLPIAKDILGTKDMEINAFKDELKSRTGMGNNRIADFIRWAVSNDEQLMSKTDVKSRGSRRVCIKMGKS